MKAAPFATVGILVILASAAAAQEPQKQAVLTGEQFWRKHYTYMPPRMSAASAKANNLEADPAARAKPMEKYSRLGFETAPPPEAWVQPDFDDAQWAPCRGRQFVSASGGYSQMGGVPHSHNDPVFRCTDPFVIEIGLVSQRGFFRVSDKSKVKSLSLSVTYRGGFVAYLNGVEIARGHLPAGRLAPDAAAEDYGVDAWVVAEGPRKGKPLHWWEDRESKQWLVRERQAGPIQIKPELLRDGLNVLAMEMHRSEWLLEGLRAADAGTAPGGFAPLGLSVLELSAYAPAGTVEALHPKRQNMQVWNADTARAVVQDECANWDARLQPIRIVAARNGRFSGQVVVTSDKELAALTGRLEPFVHASGKGTIPASAGKLLYGAVNPVQAGVGADYLSAVVPQDANFGKNYSDPAAAMCRRFDRLLDAPPSGASSAPVWVSLNVPKDAAPGAFRSTLTIELPGQQSVKVPVELSVADWTLPDVADRVSLFNIYQSPDTLATYYKVQPWSDEHWGLIERSLKLMGANGNIALIIPLLAESQMGNEESLVPWKRKAGTLPPPPTTATAPAGVNNPVGDPVTPIVSGEFEYDFANFDRYLKTALKHHPPLRFLFTIAYAIQMGGPFGRPVSGGYVTVVEPDGQRVKMQLPRCGTSQCEALWKPLLKALRERAEQAGFKGRCLLGMPCDYNPPGEHLLMFQRAAPEYGWMHESHMRIAQFRYGKGPNEFFPVVYQSMVYTDAVPDPRKTRFYGWRHTGAQLLVGFNRFGYGPMCLQGFPAPETFRHWFETNIASDRAGAGRVGGDYWNIGAKYKGGELTSWAGGGMRGTLFGSYAHSQVGQVGMANNTHDLFAPGPDGPVTTVRFENGCEGIQLAEARIFIEKALTHKDKLLPEELATRCQALLDLRTNVLRGLILPGQADRDRRLFDLAGEVAKVLAAKGDPKRDTSRLGTPAQTQQAP